MESLEKKFRDSSRELSAFYRRVGKIWMYEELMFLGLEPELLNGLFGSQASQLLLDFCTGEPGYHIVSCQGFKIYNKYMPNANGYYLADGDSDPYLMVDLLSRLTADEVQQVGHTVLPPISGDVKSGS